MAILLIRKACKNKSKLFWDENRRVMSAITGTNLTKNNKKPLFTDSFNYSKNKDINNRLIIGSSLFGAGWGLGGLCPGPAISSIALFNINSITFVVAMFAGFYLVKFFKLSS